MAYEVRKHLLDKFLEHLCADFEGYCKLHKMRESTQGLVTFLMDRGLIGRADIQRYAVKKEMEQTLAQQVSLSKTGAVGMIAHRFNISERTIWNILKHHHERAAPPP